MRPRDLGTTCFPTFPFAANTPSTTPADPTRLSTSIRRVRPVGRQGPTPWRTLGSQALRSESGHPTLELSGVRRAAKPRLPDGVRRGCDSNFDARQQPARCWSSTHWLRLVAQAPRLVDLQMAPGGPQRCGVDSSREGSMKHVAHDMSGLGRTAGVEIAQHRRGER